MKILLVQGDQFLQMLEACFRILLVTREEILRSIRELTCQTAVAGFIHEELAVTAGRLLAVESERLLSCRVETEEVPVWRGAAFLGWRCSCHSPCPCP